MYYLHLCQLLQKVAVRHSSYYFEISCYKGSVFFFHHIFTFLTKPSWSSKFEAKRDPYPATHRRDIRCWGGGVELVCKSFDFTTYFIFTFHLQPSRVVKTILLFLEYIPGWKPIEKYDRLPWQHISSHPESVKKIE